MTRSVKRVGGSTAYRKRRTEKAEPQSTAYITRNIPYFEVLSEEGLALIEQNADSILDEVGVDFIDDPDALGLFKNAGATVRGQRVHFPRGLCKEIIQGSAPREFTQHARNPLKSVIVGGDRMVLAPAYGSPFVRDCDKGRRYGTMEDFTNFVKLTYMTPHLHHSGGTICEPVDVPVNERHLDMIYAHIRYSDKPFMGSVTHPDRARDTLEMAKILFGEDFLIKNTAVIALINANSPLTYGADMLGAARVYAENNQATIISPFVMSGAMAPVTIAGTAAQVLAEALAGMALIQLIKPGAPVVFGSFSSGMSMRSGAPTFGTPEASLVTYVIGALARRLGVPFRSGGSLCSSKITDAQAGVESANTLQTAALAGVNFMLHTAGWLEGGLVMGYEKFILDIDQAGMLAVQLNGVDLSENGQALEAIHDVGPGKHFLECAHTYNNFRSAVYHSNVADNNSFEQWVEDGELDTEARANVIWKQMLADYEPPPLDMAIDEELCEYRQRRKSQLSNAI